MTEQTGGVTTLSEREARVQETLSTQHRLTFRQLLHQTGIESEALRFTLTGLRAKGLVAQLQTVIESYCWIPGPISSEMTRRVEPQETERRSGSRRVENKAGAALGEMRCIVGVKTRAAGAGDGVATTRA